MFQPQIYHELIFDEIASVDAFSAMESEDKETGFFAFIKRICKKISDWWTKKAWPFIKRQFENFWNWLKTIGRFIKNIPHNIKVFFTGEGTYFSSKMRTEGEKAFDPNTSTPTPVEGTEHEPGDLSTDGGVTFDLNAEDIASVESTIAKIKDTLGYSSVSGYFTTLEAAKSSINGKMFVVTKNTKPDEISAAIARGESVAFSGEQDKMDEFTDKDGAAFANSTAGAAASYIKSKKDADKKVVKNIEQNCMSKNDSHAAATKANTWMGNVAAFCRAKIDYFTGIKYMIKGLFEMNKTVVKA